MDLQDSMTSSSQYVQLFGATDSLRRSSSLWHPTSEHYEGGDAKFKGRLERLKGVSIICANTLKSTRLLGWLVKRLPNTTFRWIRDDVVGMGEGSLMMCKDLIEDVERVLGCPAPDTLSRRCAALNKDWEQRGSMSPRIYPEACIILHPCAAYATFRDPLTAERFHIQYLPIGCSKLSCLCYTLWMASFDRLTDMLWLTSGSHGGKPCDDWALRGAAGEMEEVQLWRDFDKNFIDGICWRLGNKLWLLTPDMNEELRLAWVQGCTWDTDSVSPVLDTLK